MVFAREERYPCGPEVAETPEMGRKGPEGLVSRDVIEAEPGGAEAVGVGGKAVGAAASVETRSRGKGLRAAWARPRSGARAPAGAAAGVTASSLSSRGYLARQAGLRCEPGRWRWRWCI